MYNTRVNQNKSQQNIPKAVVPEDFEGMVNFVLGSNDQEMKVKVHSKIHEQLLRE
jgi:hypothetical protein